MSVEQKQKISDSSKGNTNASGPGRKMPPQSFSARSNKSIAHGGNGDVDNRRYPSLSAWTTRNKNKTPFCEWCYSEDNLEAHHIMPKAKFPQYATDDSNCRVMCKSCHTICHKQGGF